MQSWRRLLQGLNACSSAEVHEEVEVLCRFLDASGLEGRFGHLAKGRSRRVQAGSGPFSRAWLLTLQHLRRRLPVMVSALRLIPFSSCMPRVASSRLHPGRRARTASWIQTEIQQGSGISISVRSTPYSLDHGLFPCSSDSWHSLHRFLLRFHPNHPSGRRAQRPEKLKFPQLLYVRLGAAVYACIPAMYPYPAVTSYVHCTYDYAWHGCETVGSHWRPVCQQALIHVCDSAVNLHGT